MRSILIGLEIKKCLHKLNISKETQQIRKLNQHFQCAKKQILLGLTQNDTKNSHLRYLGTPLANKTSLIFLI